MKGALTLCLTPCLTPYLALCLAVLPGLLPARATAQAQVYAFTHVDVIPMDRERVLSDQTVVVEEGVITALGPAATTPVPAGATRIEARGRYLLPGLADMHAHLVSDHYIAPDYAPHELAVMVANGVTTIRNPIGNPRHLAYRKQIEDGSLLGPALYVGSPEVAGRAYGPAFHGYAVATADEARAAVRAIKAAGYDFIKLTLFLERPAYDALLVAARAEGIPVFGHVGPGVGLLHALDAGQQIEHLDEYLEALLPEGAPVKGSVSDVNVYRPAQWESLDYLDTTRLPGLVAKVVAHGVWNTPTLTFFKTAFGTGRTDEEIENSPDYRFLSPAIRETLMRGRVYYWQTNQPPSAARREKYVALRNRIVRSLYEAGAPLMIGSDAPEWGLLYGFTTHRELQSFVEAGVPPFGALQAATVNPARWLGVEATAGTVAVGKRADLVLLRANPLDDIRHTQAIDGVMVRGRWLPRAVLDRMLDEAAAAMGQAPLHAE